MNAAATEGDNGLVDRDEAGTNKNKGKLGVDLQIGLNNMQTKIRNGDIIFGDDDGAVVIAIECDSELETLLEEAERIYQRESAILSQVATGTPLLECF